MTKYLLVLPVEATSDEQAWSLMDELEDNFLDSGIRLDRGGGSVYFAEGATIQAQDVPAG